jgi:hypothetical protein
MPIPELVYSDPNVKVYVRGIRETVRALETAGVQAQDLKNIFERAGAVVERAAKVPERTGRLERSVRITKTKNRAAIRAGGKRVPYAVANHFGRYFPTTGTRVEGSFFFKKAIQEKRGQVLNIIVSGLEKLFKKYDLGDPPIRITSYTANK